MEQKGQTATGTTQNYYESLVRYVRLSTEMFKNVPEPFALFLTVAQVVTKESKVNIKMNISNLSHIWGR